MLRVFDTAVLLGVDAVCGFIGRNQQHSMDENLVDFEEQFVPLLRRREGARARPTGSSSARCRDGRRGDNWHNNIGYTPAAWIALHRICEKHGVGDQFRIHYDPSHAILMGQDTRSIFQYLKDEGYGFLIGGFHVKGQVIDARGVTAWGYGGQTMQRGDWVNGKPSPNPADQVNAWKKQVVLAEHELPGTARHDPLAYLQNRTVDWLDHQLAARELLPIDVGQHQPRRRARVPESADSGSRAAEADPAGVGSLRQAHRCGGGCMYALQHEVLASQGIPIQGVGRATLSSLSEQEIRSIGDFLEIPVQAAAIFFSQLIHWPFTSRGHDIAPRSRRVVRPSFGRHNVSGRGHPTTSSDD